MSDAGQIARQKRFYDSRPHRHLRPRKHDRYARKLAHALANSLELGREDRVLELGAGFGRFTFPLLERCGSVVAVDLSRRALADLERSREELGIPHERCPTRCLDAHELTKCAVEERFDAVVGFFFLHHLPDPVGLIGSLSGLLSPGGGIGFAEPNRRNPLFALQVACCPDMSWREERGLFRLSRRGIESAYRAAGLERIETRTLGFFPPQVVNNLAPARRLEERLERIGLLRGLLPFLLLCAHARSGPRVNARA